MSMEGGHCDWPMRTHLNQGPLQRRFIPSSLLCEIDSFYSFHKSSFIRSLDKDGVYWKSRFNSICDWLSFSWSCLGIHDSFHKNRGKESEATGPKITKRATNVMDAEETPFCLVFCHRSHQTTSVYYTSFNKSLRQRHVFLNCRSSRYSDLESDPPFQRLILNPRT